jgi:alpha-ketoglutarate-dependent taurine dioxygenase
MMLGDDQPATYASRSRHSQLQLEAQGDIVAHPTSPGRAGTAILELDSTDGRGRADRWHTDMTFLDAYPKISVLRGVVIPPYGGDTVWANTIAAPHKRDRGRKDPRR